MDESYDSYCKLCNGCGSGGCCPPTICSEVACKYGPQYKEIYDSALALNEVWYKCLQSLGVDDPFSLRSMEAFAVGQTKIREHTLKYYVKRYLERERRRK